MRLYTVVVAHPWWMCPIDSLVVAGISKWKVPACSHRVGRKGWLLTRGRAPQFNPSTPLHYAAKNCAQKGDLEVARALLEAGADITVEDEVSEGGVGSKAQIIRESTDFGGL